MNSILSKTQFISQLSEKMKQAGASEDAYSIDDDKPFRMNFLITPEGYQVFFQNLTDRYSEHTYSSLSDAVYDFCTRILSTEYAREIAESFKGDTIQQ